MNGITFATKITIARFFLVPAFVWVLLYYRADRDWLRWIALAFLAIAVASDALDGYVARQHRQRSELGAILDPLADKLLMTAGFLTLSLSATWPTEARIPPWVTIPVISRDVLLLLGNAILFMITNRLTIAPSRLGKWTAATQMASLMAVVLLWPRPALRCWWGAVVALTLLSTFQYVRYGVQLLQTNHRT